MRQSTSLVLVLAGSIAIGLGLGLGGCAQGTSDEPARVDARGTGTGSGTNGNTIDARTQSNPDGPPGAIDAPVSTVDASPPDANDPPDAGAKLACSSSADCTPDSCCVSIFGNAMPPGLCYFKILSPPCDL